MASLNKPVLALAFLCLGRCVPSRAQQGAPVSAAASGRLLTRADTVAALHSLFQTKRRSSPWFLVAAPVALGVTAGGTAIAGLEGLSGSRPNIAPMLLTLGVGVSGTVALISRYTRYTKGQEQEVLNRYESKGKLPGWARRGLLRQPVPPR